VDEPIRGSTTIVELLRRSPGGEAAQLMSALNCARTAGGAFHEPLTMAAKRYACNPRTVLEAFGALDEPNGPSSELVERAATRGG
jgi:hypothetical protein